MDPEHGVKFTRKHWYSCVVMLGLSVILVQFKRFYWSIRRNIRDQMGNVE